MKKVNVGVIFGGRSGEHEVSVRSARSVIEAIDRKRFEVIPLCITKEGRWLSPAEAARVLPETTARQLPEKTAAQRNALTILGDPSRPGLVVLDAIESLPRQRLDVVFPVLHGTYGEDGTIQGLLEMANVPYVGCGVLASACGMDKVVMKMLFQQAGLPLCRYTWFLRARWEADQARVVREVVREIGFPCFIKPANLGSSVGISKAVDRNSLVKAVELAARYDRKIIVEEGLDAREIECGVIGNEEPEASLPGEYVVLDQQGAFLDYEEKYGNTGHVEFVVPAALNKLLTARVQRMAAQAFRAVDGSGFARVDFFLRRDTGELLLNELNTCPGLTDLSGFPKMWAATNLDFTQLLTRLIALAFERHRDKSRNETSI